MQKIYLTLLIVATLLGIGFPLILSTPGSAQTVINPGHSNEVTLVWDPSPSANVVNYRVYWGTSSRKYISYFEIDNDLIITIEGLASLVTYYFSVTSVSLIGLESRFSNEVSFTPTGGTTTGIDNQYWAAYE